MIAETVRIVQYLYLLTHWSFWPRMVPSSYSIQLYLLPLELFLPEPSPRHTHASAS
jgi:hypothetical protein